MTRKGARLHSRFAVTSPNATTTLVLDCNYLFAILFRHLGGRFVRFHIVKVEPVGQDLLLQWRIGSENLLHSCSLY